jgi:phosphatidylinositol alpha-1,6-mannosyltransferase
LLEELRAADSLEEAMISSGGDVRPRILFITRKYPPSVGGMERLSHELTSHMREMTACSVIAWGYSQKLLPFFLISAFFRAVFRLSSGGYDMIHVGDALLSPIGVILKKLSDRPVAVNLHGLDMAYPNGLYQWMIRTFLPRLDLFICISRHTREVAERVGVPAGKIRVIPCGIEVDEITQGRERGVPKECLSRCIGRDVRDKKILLTVGRLVRRKGVRHFIGDILPKIIAGCPELLYVVIGSGEEEQDIREEIEKRGLRRHVILLGRVDDEALRDIYAGSDIFVMPNIHVNGDVEGFGIVALEASLAGLPVIAFAVEGIRDAIVDGRNGILVDAGDVDTFSDKVVELLQNERERASLGRKGREHTRRDFGWNRIARLYFESFVACVEGLEPPVVDSVEEVWR